jgi:hypothetical protein
MKEALRLALEALENHCGNYKLDDAGCERWNKAVAAIKEALAQPEQEPSITKEARGTLILHSGWDDLPNGTKFYTTPQKRPWVGLTDEEIAYAYTIEKKFAMQYVDAKLKEKNT